jgi:hypothetical protein
MRSQKGKIPFNSQDAALTAIIGKHKGTWVAPVKSEDYAKDRRFKSPSGHFIVKRKNSLNYGPTTTSAVLHSPTSRNLFSKARTEKKTAKYCSVNVSPTYDRMTFVSQSILASLSVSVLLSFEVF